MADVVYGQYFPMPNHLKELYHAQVELTVKNWFINRVWRESWNVGVMEAAVDDVLAESTIPAPAWLFAETPGIYNADPFLLEAAGTLYIFWEQFDWDSFRGRIMAGELVRDHGGWRLEGVRPVPLGGGEHVSYPHLVVHDGEVLMIPETAQRGRVELWRARGLPDDWVRESILLDAFPGVDSTVVRSQGRFWLFSGRGGGSENRELHLFQAADLAGPWRAVDSDPVVRDAGGARMAGNIFAYRGDLVRPAQDCRGAYGRRIVLKRIETLEPDRYREELLGIVGPSFAAPYDSGIHTLNFTAGLAVVDGKRYLGVRRLLGPVYAGVKERLRAR